MRSWELLELFAGCEDGKGQVGRGKELVEVMGYAYSGVTWKWDTFIT
jgi:hypothetical protein